MRTTAPGSSARSSQVAFWYHWPSWITELLSGLFAFIAMFLPAVLWFHNVTPRWSIALFAFLEASVVLSLTYEFVLDLRSQEHDPTHRSWSDIAQRQVGILLAFVLALLL